MTRLSEGGGTPMTSSTVSCSTGSSGMYPLRRAAQRNIAPLCRSFANSQESERSAPWTGGLKHLGDDRPVADLEDGKLSERHGWLQRLPVFKPDTHILKGDGGGVGGAKTYADALGDAAHEAKLHRILVDMVARCWAENKTWLVQRTRRCQSR